MTDQAEAAIMDYKEAVAMLTPGIEISITEVTPSGGYRLKNTFSDGHISDVDFEPFLSESRLSPPKSRVYCESYPRMDGRAYSMCAPTYLGKSIPLLKMRGLIESAFLSVMLVA